MRPYPYTIRSEPYLQGPHAQSVFLPNLRYLALGFLEEDCAISLLHSLITPGLTNVALEFIDNCTEFVKELVGKMRLPDPLPEYVSAPQRRVFENQTRPTSITNVKLGPFLCDESCAYLFYSNCPNLKRLRLSTRFEPETFASVLIDDHHGSQHMSDIQSSEHFSAISTGETTLCKQLDTLIVSGMTGHELVKLVKALETLGAPVRELKVDEKDRMDNKDEEFEWLSKHVKSLSIEFDDNVTTR
ncbi:hypothetical protein ACEPAI_9159 [Sanghuangporus weigelae]